MELEKGGLWRNWVGNQSCIARYKAAPDREALLAEMLSEANDRDLPVRCAGSGHSFTPVVGTGGLLLSLAELRACSTPTWRASASRSRPARASAMSVGR